MALAPPPSDDGTVGYRWMQWLHQVFIQIQKMAVSNFALEVSLGKVPGYSTVNKFGHAPDCDNGVVTDVWDGADGVTSTDVWVPPTAARTHTIASTSANDTDGGTGARTVQIYGLTDWDTAEVSETVTLNTGTPPTTTNSYVIIYRMKVLTWGSGGLNAGIITATATTDATVTAAIQTGENQTQMCIFGVPSTQKFRIETVCAGIIKGTGAAAVVEGNILVMDDPATNAANNTAWINKEHFSHTEGATPWVHDYHVPKKFDGPCIVKLQGTANTNNSQVTAAFDGYLVNN